MKTGYAVRKNTLFVNVDGTLSSAPIAFATVEMAIVVLVSNRIEGAVVAVINTTAEIVSILN